MPPTGLVATELWRSELGRGRPRGLAPRLGGGWLVVATFEGEAFFGGRRVTSRGGDDVAIVLLDTRGEPEAVHTLGGVEDDDVLDLAADGDGWVLGIVSDGPVEVAGTTIQPRAPVSDFELPRVVGLVTVAADGRPTALRQVPDRPSELAVAGLEGGDLVLASSFRGEDAYFGHAVVRRQGPGGEVRWEHRYPGAEVNRVEPLGERLALSVRLDDTLAVWLADPATGAVDRRHTVSKRLGSGDLGAIAGLAATAGQLVAFGETGGDVEVDGRLHDRPSYAIEPFALRLEAAGGSELRDLAVVTGRVVATGPLAGHPAAVVEVIHTGPDPAVHRGLYVALAGEAPALVPLATYRYDGDDWEHGTARPVVGEALAPYRAQLGDGHVAVLGQCGPDGSPPACLAVWQIARP